MTRADYSTTPIEANARIPAEMPIEEAAISDRVRGRFVIPVEDGGAIRGVRALDARAAAQHDVDGPVSALSQDDLIHADENSAKSWLAANPAEGGAIIDGATPRWIERAIPRVDTAIVMAGGLGQRLRPLTDSTPKPLLEVGGRKLLHRILDSLRSHGVQHVYVSVLHLADQVRAALADPSEWGMDIEFLEETTPLDTGAGLSMLGPVNRPFFVLNGDILTTLDLTLLGRQHGLSDAIGTIATYRYPAGLPYGVVHHNDSRVVRIEEKPVHRYPVNAGIYAFSPRALEYVDHGKPLAMVDYLNERASSSAEAVRSFPLIEYWNDIGTHADFERAQDDIDQLRSIS